jgi:hypothetical protein
VGLPAEADSPVEAQWADLLVEAVDRPVVADPLVVVADLRVVAVDLLAVAADLLVVAADRPAAGDSRSHSECRVLWAAPMED